MALSFKTRHPSVAGLFYAADPSSLKSQIEEVFMHRLGPGSLPHLSAERRKESIGFVAPHAGYMYSGPIAAHVYHRIASEGKPDVFVIIGPNHTGYGTLVSVMAEGEWLTPLGKVPIESKLAIEITKESTYADIDEKAHIYEHSVEVQLPFLQYIYGENFSFVPIVMLSQEPAVARDLANAIHEASEKLGRDIVVIASSDFTHYEPHDIAVSKDKIAIDAIIELDPEKLHAVVEKYGISMCGPGPVMTLLYLGKKLGSTRAELLAYATSGDVTGDKSSVVGYAAIRVQK